MSKLPWVFQHVLNFSHLKSAAFFLLLVTCYLLLVTSPVLAQELPNPLPCQEPKTPNPEILTHNWLVNENREPIPTESLHKQIVRASGPADTAVTARHNFIFTVDFSKLGALFGKSNSNYIEGKVQDAEHKQANIQSLNVEDLNKYHGALNKTAPLAMLDALKVKYVQYVLENETLAESADEFTDTHGNDPMTIYQMRTEFQEPNPDDRQSASWQDGWGKYWDKIPTSYSEYYQSYIQFRAQHKGGVDPNANDDAGDLIGSVLRGGRCPYWIDETITFVMPEFFRTTAVSGQENQVLVPSAAQSHHANDVILLNKPESQNSVAGNGSILGKIIDTCLKAFRDNPVSNALKKITGYLYDNLNINVYAEPAYTTGEDPNEDTNTACIKVLVDGKEGRDPYCAMPQNQPDTDLEYTCTNQIDDLKLDSDNPNVICTFTIKWQRDLVLSAGQGENQFDTCSGTSGAVTCTVAVSLWPVFEIPWQAEIWNNAMYSDQNEPLIGSQLQQVEGRPGVYSFFTPITIFEDEFEEAIRKCNREPDIDSESCRFVIDYVFRNAEGGNQADITLCIYNHLLNEDSLVSCFLGVAQHIDKKRPAETDRQSENDLRFRLNGGFECPRGFVKGNALLSRGVQAQFNITNDCTLEGNFVSNPLLPPIVGNVPPNANNCNGKYDLSTNPLGSNFGDPLCDFSDSGLYDLLRTLDPTNADYWYYTIAACETTNYNPNGYTAISTSGQAFGLFQMGHAAYPQFGLDYQIGDGQTNGYDRGDVIWQLQTSNAVNYNNTYINGDFSYWACAT